MEIDKEHFSSPFSKEAFKTFRAVIEKWLNAKFYQNPEVSLSEVTNSWWSLLPLWLLLCHFSQWEASGQLSSENGQQIVKPEESFAMGLQGVLQ